MDHSRSPGRIVLLLTLLWCGACSSPVLAPHEFAKQLPPERKLSAAERVEVDKATAGATAQLLAGNYILARDLANEALDINPRAARARAVLGRSLMGLAFQAEPRDLRRAESAEGHLLMAIELDPRDPEIRLFYAQLLIAEGHLNRAAGELDKLLAIHPRHRQGLRTAADVRYELAEERAAEVLLQRYLTEVPGSAWGLYRLAHCRLQLGDAHLRRDSELPADKKPTDAAIESYNAAAQVFLDYRRVAPEDAAGFLGEADARCRALFASGNKAPQEKATQATETILGLYGKARDLAPKNPATHHGEGVIYEYREEISKARLAYERAMKLDANYVPSMLNLAGLLHGMGEAKAAKELWRRVLLLDITPEEKRQIEKLLAGK